MDGHFVENLILSPWVIEQIQTVVSIPIDAHLMVTHPEKYLDALLKTDTMYITMHIETLKNNAYILFDKIKKNGRKFGIAISPESDTDFLRDMGSVADKITIMTVTPGFSGNRFLPDMLDKIRKVKAIREHEGFSYLIEADGACRKENFKLLSDAGTEVFVVGTSGLFSLHPDTEKAWELMMRGFNQEVKG